MTEKHSILITGGAGYLGSTMVPEFLAAGHRVTVLDSFIFQQNSLAHVCANPDFQIVRGDCRDQRIMADLIKKADVVIPLAALVGAPLCSRDEIGTVSINRDAVVMLCKMLSPQQRVLMPVSNSGYGIGEAGKHCDEKSPLRPISLYGRVKVEAEEAMMQHPNAISFRLATVFGMSPRMRIDLLVNDFVYRAVHDRAVVLFESHFKRNYIHVRDVTRVFLHALGKFSDMKGEIYNVGLSDANLSKRELCTRIQAHLPHFVAMDAPIGEDPDKRDYIVSNDKIEATGFKPAHGLDLGIQELIKGYTMLRNTRYSNV
ncbi:MAG: SDR family oxidoreductase [Magnetococcales bacterium]|nr:SDR family oxidoreductase [Magnetococcales bacterium]MBF0321413.1 SDR family oxidoreductase [Magnetococcales bacterium]